MSKQLSAPAALNQSVRRFLCFSIAAWVITFVPAEAQSTVLATKPRPDPGPITLPAPVEKVKLRPELIGAHPRIFFDAKGLETLKAKVKDPRLADIYAGFLAYADKAAADVPPASPKNTLDPFRSYGTRLPCLAFAYLVTNDPKYLAAAKTWIHAINGYPAWFDDEDLATGQICFGMAVAYDWLYSNLSPEERHEIEESLLRHARIMVKRSHEKVGSWWGYAYFQNHCWINHTGIAATALALYDTAPEEMQGWLDYTRTQFQPTYQDIGIDGGYHEGPGYARYGTIWFLTYIEMLRSVSGEDLTNMTYLQGALHYFFASLMPDWKSMANFGDCPPSGWGSLDDLIPVALGAINHDGHGEWLRTTTKAASGARYGGAEWTADNSPFLFTLLFADPSLAPKPPDDYPLVGLYPDQGMVYFRTSWKPDAAMVAFHCGPPGGLYLMKHWNDIPNGAPTFGHSHPDAGSFLFWANNDWRVGAPGEYTRKKVTHNENTWTIGDHGQKGGDGEWFVADSYVGKPDQPHLVTVATSPAADYVVGDATAAYPEESQLTQFRRHLLFVKGASPYVVVYDQLAASSPQAWNSYLHFFGEVGIQGQQFQAGGKSPSYGQVFGPGNVALSSQPLVVISHPYLKPETRGFEVEAVPEGKTNSTWLISVVGLKPQQIKMTGTAPAPALTVDGDQIAWTADDGVTFNGTPISGNLLPATEMTPSR